MRVTTLGLLLGTAAVLPAAPPAVQGEEAPGRVVGTVRFTGEVPPPEKIPTTDGGMILHRDLVVDEQSRGLRDVFVTLKDAPPQPKLKIPGKPVVVDQRDMIFTPRVAAVQHGRKVRFENNDIGNHGVTAISKLPANSFNVIASPGMPVEHLFEPQEFPVVIGCSLHGWMRAYIFVTRHPWFAVTDAKGQFAIRDVPPGEYTLSFVHPDTGLRAERKVAVRPGGEAEVTVEWEKTRR